MTALPRGDRGSAALEFALVAPLVLLVALAVLQVALALHVRATLTAAAAEGARRGALADSGMRAAEATTRSVLASTLAGGVVDDVRATTARVDGLPVVAVRIDARLPVLGLLGPPALVVEGHALQEVS